MNEEAKIKMTKLYNLHRAYLSERLDRDLSTFNMDTIRQKIRELTSLSILDLTDLFGDFLDKQEGD